MKNELFISEHFTINEMLKNNHGILNWCSPSEMDNLIDLTQAVLEPTRKFIKAAIFVTSGYRNRTLNALVGGEDDSQHPLGEAVDFKCKDMVAAFEYIKNNLDFDQLIWEKGTKKCPAWIHVSFTTRRKNRKQVLYIF